MGSGPRVGTPATPADARNENATPAAEGEVSTGTAEAEKGSGGLDDFEPLEGIGPRINEILHEAGISTYEMLAEADIERLRYVLRQANLPLADPESWPQQASLAARGDWQGLEALKRDLKAGRRSQG
jgi:predicted flap endonuclease-1-like 5' DNA nuclease